ncbi:glutathione S-transferase family protein [Notoacmeibacter sp. MSK16QG-6]|uniref:glutathione S-transferase family protein n=1 Tax=Notoacmeibacter sp. MSK16QG-6 TaxID=2957982 RepID=UPI0020A0EB9A|nr:glutathione S-transferase family protein [Notoacmeibacter sp. MSK16QG-6]MCP1199904.1 glutathione S-transferase family protein [Notoacmeibacter sp. MSK16QG-6]
MGQLVDGEWKSSDVATVKNGGFERQASTFRNWVTKDGSAGPSGEGGFPAVADRYHLYVSHACPWAHRTLIMRHLKGLEAVISASVVHWHMGDEGWSFRQEDGATGDTLYGKAFLHEIYQKADPSATCKVTVPVLWDKQKETIVSNESSEIIRMLNSAFAEWASDDTDYYPDDLKSEIDAVNDLVYPNVNNGVYRAGFAKAQEKYEEAYADLFGALDELEDRLSSQRYLTGDRFTEADIRLFTTLIRFDAVYHYHFKCNRNRLADMPNLSGFMREIYQMPGIAETVHLDHIKGHYYTSHPGVNPTGIVPKGPVLDFDSPHGRG